MLRRYNRLLITFYVVSDAISAAVAFASAYILRFDSALADIIPITKNVPPFSQYVVVLPVVALLVPLSFHVQGLYRLRRGRTRVDDFFAVLVGSILAVLLAAVGTLYIRAYYPAFQDYHPISRAAWGLFLVINVLFTYASREIVRDLLRRRWRAGIGLKRVLIVGAGDLGSMVADRILEHSELGF